MHLPWFVCVPPSLVCMRVVFWSLFWNMLLWKLGTPYRSWSLQFPKVVRNTSGKYYFSFCVTSSSNFQTLLRPFERIVSPAVFARNVWRKHCKHVLAHVQTLHTWAETKKPHPQIVLLCLLDACWTLATSCHGDHFFGWRGDEFHFGCVDGHQKKI